MEIGILALTAYFLGSLPFSYWAVKLLTGEDVRNHFSGNAGATNAGRVLKEVASKEWVRQRAKLLTQAIFVLDVLKGTLAVSLFHLRDLGDSWAVLGGGLAILGHMFSPFLSFKGGKGVATALGMLFGLVPLVALLSFGVWFFVFKLSGFVSLGSVMSALSAPCLFFLVERDRFFNETATTGVLIFMALVITLKHHSNIKKILNGTEPSYRKKKI